MGNCVCFKSDDDKKPLVPKRTDVEKESKWWHFPKSWGKKARKRAIVDRIRKKQVVRNLRNRHKMNRQ